MLEINFADVPKADDINVGQLAERLDGFSGADVKAFTEAASDFPYQRQIETGVEQVITQNDIEKALRKVKPSVDARMMARYENYRQSRSGG